MDEHALRVLEYNRIRRQLMELTACSLGRERAEAMMPSDHFAYVRARLDETTECRRLIDERGTLPFGGASDIRPVIHRAEIGAVLDARELLSVQSTAASSRSLKLFLQKLAADYPIMAEHATGLAQFPSLESEIESCIGLSGMILDTASPELARIRSQKKITAQRMQDKLNQIISGPMRTLLQDSVIVQRGDRYCVPVKAEHRGAFGGIVHDTSASGATLFMEPQAVVDLGNDLRELAIKESQEEARILARLSDSVRRIATPFNVAVETIGLIDYIAARARLSQELNAAEPELTRNGIVRLTRARHPLIDPQIVVPIDIELGAVENKVVLITGPNTGGKTVSLKTVGLFVLMAMSGLHVPASRAEVSVFYQVFADIGDEQSLQQSLSTFSGHMSNIVATLRELKSNALVLLDEIGAGTDPGEGAALARAILDHLRAADARVIATTHYGELKAYALVTDGVQNASVEFDEKTLSPTYRLMQGVPGSSNAFAIAARLGMPEPILAESRQNLTGSDETADLMRELEESRRRAQADAREAERARLETQMLRRRYEEELTNLQALRREARQKANDETRTVIRRAQERIDNTIAEVRRAGVEGRRTERARQRIHRIADELQSAIERTTVVDEPEEIVEVAPGRLLRAGDRVRVVSLDMLGDVLEDEQAGQAVPVQVGAMRVSVPSSALRLQGDGTSSPAPAPARPVSRSTSEPATTTSIATQKAIEITPQLTLLGQRADEALQNVEKYLDDAYAAGVTRARLVHGKGTGALRRAVHQLLDHHPLVTEYATADPDEGGAGATVVMLRES